MSVHAESQGIIGAHYRFPDYFEVSREKIREFARSVKADHPMHFDEAAAAAAGYPALVAPPTFLAIAGRQVQLEIFTRFNIPINIARVLHRDQKFIFHRPILAGDRLYFDTYLDSVLESHGTVISEIRSEITDAHAQPIVTSVVTMLGESVHQEADTEAATIAAIASIPQQLPVTI